MVSRTLRYDIRGSLVLERGLVHHQEDVDVAEARHVSLLLDRATELGLHHVFVLMSENVTHALEVSRNGLRIPALVLKEQFAPSSY